MNRLFAARTFLSPLFFSLICFGFVAPANAITFEEFDFKLAELKREMAFAEKEIAELSSVIEQMKADETTLQERDGYIKELLASVKYMEELKKKIEDLKKLLPEVKIYPVLKLVKIEPKGIPGVLYTEPRESSHAPAVINSFRIRQVPTEIVAGRQFTVSADVIYRKYHRKGHSCENRSTFRGGDRFPRLQLRALTGLPDAHMAGLREANIEVAVDGGKYRVPFCEEAPTDTDPDTGEVKQASFEKESRVSLTANFIPVREDKNSEGRTSYLYKVNSSTSGYTNKKKEQGYLITASTEMTGKGFCARPGARTCSGLLIELSGTGGRVALHYKQVAAGEPFIDDVPTFAHPGELGKPPEMGAIKLATIVPDLKGRTLEQAEWALKSAELKAHIGPPVTAPSQEHSGKVKETNPKAGTRVKLGSSVVVTAYSKMITVPKLIGLSSTEASDRLRAIGLEKESQIGPPAPKKALVGKIALQSPEEGTPVAAGTKVTIYLHGPYVQTVVVPQLVNKLKREAINVLQQIGLKYEVKIGKAATNQQQQDYVTDQDPAVDTQVAKGSLVKLTVWGPPQLTGQQICARGFPGSTYQGNRTAQGGPQCDCPNGKWVGKRCVPLTDAEVCAREFPGSTYQGNRTVSGGPMCDCLNGTWQGKVCVPAPQLTDQQICARNFPGSTYQGNRTAQGGPQCDCLNGQWQGRNCVPAPQLTDQQKCTRDFPGSTFQGVRAANGGPQCDCPNGQWQGRSCVATTGGGGWTREDQCRGLLQSIAESRRRGDQVQVRNGIGLARALGCNLGGIGGGDEGGGVGNRAGNGCIYHPGGLLGQDPGTFGSGWEGSAGCTCNGRPAPLSACGR